MGSNRKVGKVNNVNGQAKWPSQATRPATGISAVRYCVIGTRGDAASDTAGVDFYGNNALRCGETHDALRTRAELRA